MRTASNSVTQYKNNYLKSVVVRLDYETAIDIAENGPPDRFVRSLKKKFPSLQQVKKREQTLKFSPKGMEREVHEKSEWNLLSQDRTAKLHFGAQHLAITYSKYKSFSVLKSDFETAFIALRNEKPELSFTRVGLRYIDQLEFDEADPTDWGEYLIPELLSSFSLADDKSTISRAFHVLEFNYGDMKMKFQYGMPNPDFPSPIKKKLFILDYDAYSQGEVAIDRIMNCLGDYHAKIKRSFEQVITDGLRAKMGGADG